MAPNGVMLDLMIDMCGHVTCSSLIQLICKHNDTLVKQVSCRRWNLQVNLEPVLHFMVLKFSPRVEIIYQFYFFFEGTLWSKGYVRYITILFCDFLQQHPMR